MKAFKGFNKDLQCTPSGKCFQYEIGSTYEEDSASLCHSGFHACERPLDVFNYYAPSGNRFCEVDLDGVSEERHSDDSKLCGKSITVGLEIGIPGLVKAQIEYVKSKTTMEFTDPKQATAGYKGAATAGYKGAATAGYKGAATAGEYGAATAGNSGAATAGNSGAATAGEYGAATAGEYGAATAGEYGAATSRGRASVGKNGIACVRGDGVKVRGDIGSLLVIGVENDDDFDLKEWKAFTVDGKKIKANTFYTLRDGKLVVAEDE